MESRELPLSGSSESESEVSSCGSDDRLQAKGNLQLDACPVNASRIVCALVSRRDLYCLILGCIMGVLVAVSGPNLETRAEYRMLRQMGADIVGMSTVPEVIVANHAGMKTIGFSVVTDMCLPDALEAVDIEKILKVAAEGGARLEQLIADLFRQWGEA